MLWNKVWSQPQPRVTMSGEEHPMVSLGEWAKRMLRFALGDTSTIRKEYNATERGSERRKELLFQMVDIKVAKANVRAALDPDLGEDKICQFVRAVYGEDRPDSVAKVQRWLCKVQKMILSLYYFHLVHNQLINQPMIWNKWVTTTLALVQTRPGIPPSGNVGC
jgi:hypothetical protein